jgi:HTH-type transcriptional regulator/antitoxin HigA
MQPIKPIRTEADYERALQEINLYLDADEGSEERDRLELLTILVDDYESKHIPIPFPDPIVAIQFVLDQRGLTRKDLLDVIGSSGRISEVMNKQRPLTLSMIRKLIAKFDIPAEVLIRSSEDVILKKSDLVQSSSGRSPVIKRTIRAKARLAV